ncbi:uncharacterized protein LOC6541354 [Drosophila erecta]|uniref:Uncharacterized protein n=1 Tax=Drosophila erecta TaxID=7220 RepID=B3N8F5_DROER|nr:uncharacterized protein LOC6541354 [Drosophila erecta]EDV58378.1 uncharacterized protein Dere_GG24020 [Drosophila erecta]
MGACRPRKCIVDQRTIAVRRRRTLIRLIALHRLVLETGMQIMNRRTPTSIEILGPARRLNSRRRSRRNRRIGRRMLLGDRRPRAAFSMPSLGHPGQNPFSSRTNPLWGQANIITTPRSLAALNGLASGNREPNSLSVMVRYLDGRFHFTLASSEDTRNENHGVQNGQHQEAQGGNDRNLHPAAQAADENNNVQNQNPQAPDADDANGRVEVQEDQDAQAQNRDQNEE